MPVRVRPSAPDAAVDHCDRKGTLRFKRSRFLAEWCNGSTRDFESHSPGSNPGSAAIGIHSPVAQSVERAAVNR